MYPRALLNAARARAAPLAARQLHATPVAAKTMAEKAADVADTVNKKVGKGLASALETGEKATEKTKETLGAADKQAGQTAEKAKTKAAQQTGEYVKDKAAEAGDQASATKNEAKAEANKPF